MIFNYPSSLEYTHFPYDLYLFNIAISKGIILFVMNKKQGKNLRKRNLVQIVRIDDISKKKMSGYHLKIILFF